ncbi:4Fe-4S binding protein [Maridesulfovibrio hydrothermalis]|uniref:Nitrite and sulphite reductase 4Fe-4S region n=1 Tax=Maridesulfovibrio hydrothermalis AM13 = DSM 14728 TaxID=1121451 RepID=L0R629_9BACT|nr:4Fe-4S binding protein [Maridesulfovibrio hydrothermalis]CCO22148.1 Nitrite and sulphite reductase 4Fe-4S region [Maridesulfovibrio hydrothermalis AM13 = DSM 14728]
MGKTASINICRGICGEECRFALFVEKGFDERIEKVITESGWPEFLNERYGGKVNPHKMFTVNGAACPNGCSRPHIADIGLIRSCVPVIDHEQCIACEECVRSCPDEAMEMVDGRVVITREKCLVCGICVRFCPTEVISCSRNGWRVLAGGRLGRHPRLGTELPGVFSSDEALTLVSKALRIWMDNYEEDKRFGWVMDRIGYEKLLED